MRHNQAGRSMVEILGVLAIIALLSIIGLYGYRWSMNKHKANEVISAANKRAVLVAAQIAALGDNVKDEDLEDLNDAYNDGDYVAGRDEGEVFVGSSPRRGGANFRVKRYDPKFKEFAVIIPEMEKDVCREILNSLGNGSQIQYLMTSEEKEIVDCNENLKDVEVVYNEDLSPSKGNQTTYLDSDVGDGKSNGTGSSSGNSQNKDKDFEEEDDDNNNDDDENANASDNVCPRGQKRWEQNCIFCDKYDNCGCRVLGQVADGKGACMCSDEGAEECNGNTALSCKEGYFLENDKCYICPEKYETCDNGGLTCSKNYMREGITCICDDDSFYNGEKCTSDCWDQNMSIESIIKPSTSYFSRCNQLCGTGKFYAYNKTDCEQGAVGAGTCQNLPTIREKIYSASDDAKAAKLLGFIDDKGDPILLGEEEALRLTQNMVWYDRITHYYNSASICNAVGKHLASIDDIGCEDRTNKSTRSKCKKNGTGSKVVQALISVYLHGATGNIPSFISGTRNGCVPAHIWLNQAELNYDSRTKFDISKQTAGASTLCVD